MKAESIYVCRFIDPLSLLLSHGFFRGALLLNKLVDYVPHNSHRVSVTFEELSGVLGPGLMVWDESLVIALNHQSRYYHRGKSGGTKEMVDLVHERPY